MPIYMPIPIPVPMPMPQKPHAPPQQHHHHSQDGEGEVKKIYILQPMPKIHGVKTQVHTMIQPPTIHHPPKPYRYSSGDGEYGHEASRGSQQKDSGGNKHDSLKILPIVVIPPIAPMNPIHISAGGANDYHSGSYKRKFGSIKHRNSLANEHKSFADYGGNGGGNMYRSMRASKVRNRMKPFGQTTKLSSMSQDDLMDDYDLSPVPWQSDSRPYVSSQNHHRPTSFRGRYGNDRLSRISSIQDALDSPDMFDDEPTSGFEDLRGSNRISRYECCGPRASGSNMMGRRSRYTPDHGSDSSVLSQESQERDSIQTSGSLSGLEQYHLPEEKVGSELIDRGARLHERFEHERPYLGPTGKDLHRFDQSIPLDHDEWAYESKNSISVSTNTNETLKDSTQIPSPKINLNAPGTTENTTN